MNWLTCRGSKGEEKVLVLTGVSMEVSDGSPTLQSLRVTYVCVGVKQLTCPTPSQVCLTHYQSEFIKLARRCPAVLCCRCSPSHKAQIVNLIKSCTKRLTWGVGETWALKSAHSAVVAYHATFVFS